MRDFAEVFWAVWGPTFPERFDYQWNADGLWLLIGGPRVFWGARFGLSDVARSDIHTNQYAFVRSLDEWMQEQHRKYIDMFWAY